MADEKTLTQDGVLGTPEEAFRAIDADSARAGGPWVAPEGYEIARIDVVVRLKKADRRR